MGQSGHGGIEALGELIEHLGAAHASISLLSGRCIRLFLGNQRILEHLQHSGERADLILLMTICHLDRQIAACEVLHLFRDAGERAGNACDDRPAPNDKSDHAQDNDDRECDADRRK